MICAAIADIYLIDGLKIICEKSLVKYISLETVCDLVVIAQKHNANELKKSCIDYLMKNISKIYGTKEYEKLEKFPALLVEVTRRVLDNANLLDI